jgi:hypothetical protein
MLGDGGGWRLGVDVERDRLASWRAARVVDKMMIEGFARDVDVEREYVLKDGRQ